jgi:RHS repeat-associated protein
LLGLDVIGQQASSGWGYFGYDGLGSVRLMTDSAGALAYIANYDPYGLPLELGGDFNTSLGFTGEMTDPTGMVYLRARYMSPQMGMFLTKDPFEGVMQRVMSRNGYTYVEGNPVNYTDPSGEFLFLLTAAAGLLAGQAYGTVIGNATFNMMEAGQCGCRGRELAQAIGRQQFVGHFEERGRFWGAITGGLVGLGPLGIAVAGAVGVGHSVAGAIDAILLQGLLNEDRSPNLCSILELGLSILGARASLGAIRSNFSGAAKQLGELPGRIVDTAVVLYQTAREFPNTVRDARGLNQIVQRFVPNPGGRRGSPEHQAMIARRIRELEAQGYEHIGGGNLPEEIVLTPGGQRNHRFIDITMRAPDGSIYREQVGVAYYRSGVPVLREVRALNDIEAATGSRPVFTPYKYE